jgi:glycolate oxidase iron-sulfur subunit
MPPTPADAPPADAARVAALADRCVQCGLCLPHCPTYRLDRIEAEGPRGRIAYAKAVAAGTLEPTPAGDRHLDQCLGCRRCEQACPAGVRYEDLLVLARAGQAARGARPEGHRAARLLGHPLALAAALPLARLARRLPAVPSAAPVASPTPTPAPRGTVDLFVGCVASTYESSTRRALVRLLAAAGWDAVEPPGQGCCGTAAAHAGDAAGAESLAHRNRAAFGERPVLSLASGCQSILAASLAGRAEVGDALAFLSAHGDALRFRPARTRVALHLPCSQRVLGGDTAARALLARIPGLDLVELPDTGCCGAAGTHMLAEPGRAALFRAPLLESLAASGATQLLSANIGCRLHLANAASIPVRHPVDFLAEHLA